MHGIDFVKLYLSDSPVRLIGGDALGEVIVGKIHTEWRKTRDLAYFREVTIAREFYMEINSQANQYGLFDELSQNNDIYKIEIILRSDYVRPKTLQLYFDVFTDTTCSLHDKEQFVVPNTHGDLVICINNKLEHPHNKELFSNDVAVRDEYWKKVQMWDRSMER